MLGIVTIAVIMCLSTLAQANPAAALAGLTTLGCKFYGCSNSKKAKRSIKRDSERGVSVLRCQSPKGVPIDCSSWRNHTKRAADARSRVAKQAMATFKSSKFLRKNGRKSVRSSERCLGSYSNCCCELESRGRRPSTGGAPGQRLKRPSPNGDNTGRSR